MLLFGGYILQVLCNRRKLLPGTEQYLWRGVSVTGSSSPVVRVSLAQMLLLLYDIVTK